MCGLLLLPGALRECQFDHTVTVLFRSTKAFLLFCLLRPAMTERAVTTLGLSTSGVVQGPRLTGFPAHCMYTYVHANHKHVFLENWPGYPAHGLSSSDHFLSIMSALSETPPCASDEGGPSILHSYQGLGFMSFSEL